VRDIVAELRPFAADFASFSHFIITSECRKKEKSSLQLITVESKP
jgi:hypothetical protein